MVELNEKAVEHDRIWLEPAGAPDRCWCEDNQWGDEGVEYVRVSALPAPDDGLVERLRYRVENPSAWDSFDQGGSDLCREAATALQTQAAELQHLRADAENPDKGMWTFWNKKAQELAEQIERLELSRGAASKVALDAIAEKERAEARIKSLEKALGECKEALLAAEDRDNRARFRANTPRGDAEVVHLRTTAIRRARTTLQKEQADGK